jgi:hypothetical protein
MVGQLTRAGIGVAGNYRSAGRAQSHVKFTARLGVVLEEADESELWLDVCQSKALILLHLAPYSSFFYSFLQFCNPVILQLLRSSRAAQRGSHPAMDHPSRDRALAGGGRHD